MRDICRTRIVPGMVPVMIEIPWLLISTITLWISIICGVPLWMAVVIETNPGSFGSPSIFTSTVIKICIVLFLICCVSIPTHFYAEGQRPYTITPQHDWNTVQIQNITSLSDDQRWSMNGGGHFFLGSGTMIINGGSVHEYVFYKVTPNGYQLGTLDATNVFIKEDENKYPYVEWVYSHTTNPLKRWDDDGTVDYTMNGKESVALVGTYIHVPDGTIIKDYSLGGK